MNNSLIKLKSGKSNIVLIVIFSVLLVFLVISVAIGASFFGMVQHGEAAPNTLFSHSIGASGCYLKDEAFTDTSTIKNAQDVLDKMSGANKRTLESYEKEENSEDKLLSKLIKESKSAGINPALPIAIWAGEQGFKSLEKAFGCGVYDNNGDGKTDNLYPTFDKQLSCALDKINDAVNNRGYYTKPAGANIFTRLFYNYTGAMKENYLKTGYVAKESNARIVILNKLVSDQVVCTQNFDFSIAGGDVLKVPSLKQCGQSYSGVNMGFRSGKGTVCSAGCALTSLAMVDRFVNRSNITPDQVGYRFGAPDTAPAVGCSNIESHMPGLKVVDSKTDVREFPFDWINQELKAGYPILWQFKDGYLNHQGEWTHETSHFVVIIGLSDYQPPKMPLIITNDPAPVPSSDPSAGFKYSGDINKYFKTSSGKFNFCAIGKK